MKSMKKLFSGLLLLLVIAFFILPFLWIIFASFDTHATLNFSLPQKWQLSNYVKVFSLMQRPFLNSLYIACLTTIVCVITSSIAAYPLSRFEFKGKNLLLYGMLFLSILPITAMMVPTFSMFVSLHMIDKLWSVSFFIAATRVPMTIWIIKNFYDTISIELEEASWVDGATKLTSLIYIVFPLALPGITVAAILTFLIGWGNFYIPFFLIMNNEKMPLSVNLYSLYSESGSPFYGQIAAYSLLYTVPILILHSLVSKNLVAGLNVGGIKG